MGERRFQVRQSGRKLQVARSDWAGNESEIEEDTLRPFVDEVRADLANLCEEYIRFPGVDASRETASLNLLRMLARNGASLKNAILLTDDERRQSQSSAESLESYTFVVAGDVRVHVPWGLLFDESPGADFSLLSDEELRAGFWAMKHDVSAVYRSGKKMSLDDPSVVGLGETGLLGVFHNGAVEFADPEERLKWPTGLRVSSIKDLKEHFMKRDTDCLLYFFCHAKEDVLQINDDKRDALNPARLRGIMGSDPHGAGFFILNGCKTGVSHKGARGGRTWLEVTRDRALLGFVGTEAVVPTIFAWNLGKELLYLMLVKGKTAVDAMHDLRRRHWPLSLLYGLYCVPNLTAKGTVGFLEREELRPMLNYSLIDLGQADHERATLPFGSLSSGRR